MRQTTHDSRKVAEALLRKHGERALILYGKPVRSPGDWKELRRLIGWARILSKLARK